jgi:hypothetical protein
MEWKFRNSIVIPFYGELPELVLELVVDDIDVYLDELVEKKLVISMAVAPIH